MDISEEIEKSADAAGFSEAKSIFAKFLNSDFQAAVYIKDPDGDHLLVEGDLHALARALLMRIGREEANAQIDSFSNNVLREVSARITEMVDDLRESIAPQTAEIAERPWTIHDAVGRAFAIVGVGKTSADRSIAPGETVVTYRSLDDKSEIFVSPSSEFYDGRFSEGAV